MDLSFYQNKSVLVTGHTGFKGAWLCKLLLGAGAKLTGYGLSPSVAPNLFELCRLSGQMNSVVGDIRDLQHLEQVFNEVSPEIVIHLAAQALVRESYHNPVYTYETNVIGTVNVLECVRRHQSVRSVVMVTTDKVYRNREWLWGYRENEELNGFDPYSNSKSCAELVAECYRNSFFAEGDVAVSTCRAGNVIGGGDFATDRIIPDCVRAAASDRSIMVRNPYSVRPYQHVLEPLMAYLMIAREQYEKKGVSGCYNIGPDEAGCLTTEELVNLFCAEWVKQTGNEVKWDSQPHGGQSGAHEAGLLKLDCAKIKQTFGWRTRWGMGAAVEEAVRWYVCHMSRGDIPALMDRQIARFTQDKTG